MLAKMLTIFSAWIEADLFGTLLSKRYSWHSLGTNNMKKILIVLALMSSACTPTRYVEPLPDETFNITVAAGGALFDYQGATIPLPLTSVVAGYGVNDDSSVWGALHTTSAAFGVLHTEVGGIKRVYSAKQYLPSISIAPSAHFMIDRWDKNKRFYPVIDANLYWKNVFSSDLFYLGVNNWFVLSSTKAHGQKQQNRWIPSLVTGYSFRPGQMQYSLETKYIAPNYSNENIVVDYLSPNSKGALGVFFSIGRSF